MKNRLIYIVLTIFTLFSFALCAACSPNNEETMQYTVSFNSNGGSEVLEINVDDGEKCVEPIAPKKEATAAICYEFEYWYEVDESIPFDFNSFINKDITLNAKWVESARKYSIAFKNYDGKILQVVSVEYGELPEYTSSIPVKEEEANKKFVFSGWDKEIVKVTKDETYIAQFSEKETFCITFEMEDGTFLSSKRLYVGELFDFFAIPVDIPKGKDFYGWVLKENTDVILTSGVWEMEENITVIPLFKDEAYGPIY